MGTDLGKTSTGLEPNVAGLLCYLAGFVSGIIFLLIEKDNKFVRFHAMQSIITFGAIFVLEAIANFMPFLGGLLTTLLGAACVVAWILCMIKAYQGEKFKLPVIGDIAEQKM